MNSIHQTGGPKKPDKNKTTKESNIQKIFSSTLNKVSEFTNITNKEREIKEKLGKDLSLLKTFNIFERLITKRTEYKNLKTEIKSEKNELKQINQFKTYVKQNLFNMFNQFRNVNSPAVKFDLDTSQEQKIKNHINELKNTTQKFDEESKAFEKLNELVENNFQLPKDNTDEYRMNPPLEGKFSTEEKKLIKEFSQAYNQNKNVLNAFDDSLLKITNSSDSEEKKMNDLMNLYLSKDYVDYNKALTSFTSIHEKFEQHENLAELFTTKKGHTIVFSQRLTRVKMPMEDILKTLNINAISQKSILERSDSENLLIEVQKRITDVANVMQHL